jgi:DNA-binding response OmpR family regulator
MKRILLVEDDAAIARGLEANFRAEGYEVVVAADGEAGYARARMDRPDLLVLDLMLPKLGGYELCRRLRQEGFAAPILILTARGEESDRVLGLDLGADDYVTKPFALREILARVRALLRRGPAGVLPAEIRFGAVIVDFQSFRATRGSQELQLTRKEMGALRFLASRPGVVVRREELLREVWEYREEPTTRTVDNHIASLRRKLEEDPAHPVHLQTVHGVGYKLIL